MKIKIIPQIRLTLEIDGERIDGEFKLDGLWNGLACLRGAGGECRYVIIKHPGISHLNVYDSVLKLFGGNAASDADIKPVEAEGVSKDFQTPSEVAKWRREMQKKAAPAPALTPA